MGLFRFGIAVLAGGLAGAVSAAACSHAPPPAPGGGGSSSPQAPCATPEPLRVSLQATTRLNPGEQGEALAVVVRLYQLKGSGKLQGAAFDDLLDHDKEILSDEFVAVTEQTINPGERLEPSVVRNPEAVYVAAVALFRRPAGTTWRTVIRLAPPDPQYCHSGGGAKGSVPPAGPTKFILDENRIDLR